MIKIEKQEVVGWEPAMRGMRNPMNSWDRGDTYVYSDYTSEEDFDSRLSHVCLGENDLGLARKLANGGPVHAKYRRMITVYVDITAPLYWWKEFDTYKVGTVANSCSTMHKIQAKEFEMSDFSHEHLMGLMVAGDAKYRHSLSGVMTANAENTLYEIIRCLNTARAAYLETKDKKYWWQMIQLLPSSYNQKRTVMLNYEVLNNIYHSRKNHKLDEWHHVCKWIEELPYSELIIGEKNNDQA